MRLKDKFKRGFGWMVACWMLPLTAYASSDNASSGAGSSEVGTVVLLICFVAAAYLATHFLVDKLQNRFLVVTGIEYILLGILLGPVVPQIRAFEDLTPLMPVIALAAGWVGLLRGMVFDVRKLQEYPAGVSRIVFFHHVVPALLVSLVFWFLIESGPEALGFPSSEQVGLSVFLLACTAAVEATGSIELIRQKYELKKGLADLLYSSSRVGDVLVILAFGILFCVFRAESPNENLILRPTEWAMISVGLGALLGLLFIPFVGDAESTNRQFLALVGIITFASGAAWFLQISPLLVNLAVGCTLVNASKGGDVLSKTMARSEKPLYLVLLVLAGALWRPPPWLPTVVGISIFIGVRLMGKWMGSRMATWGTSFRQDMFRGLLGHGQVTVAMAVSFRLVYEGPLVDIVYSIVLSSVFLHDLVAPRLLRALLVDAGEIKGEVDQKIVSGKIQTGEVG